MNVTAMREGRDRYLAEQRRAARKAVGEWHQWLRDERDAFARYTAARNDGADAGQVDQLRAAWRAVLKRGVMPRDSQFALMEAR